MSGFTKLFESILDSSVWELDDQTVRVWITLMALADMDGEVHNTIPGLARRAKVSIEACEAALVAFMSPDKYSRTKAHDGRRIEEIEEGWRLLNHPKYRRMFSLEEQREKAAKRTREWREREAGRTPLPHVTDRHGPSPAVTSDASDDIQKQKQIQKAEADQNPPKPPEGGGGGSVDLPEPSDAGAPVKDAAEIAGIFDFWRKEFKHPNAKLDRKRRAKIRERLRDGFTARELCFAIRGAKKDEFLMGKNDRAMVYDDVTVLLRDAGKVEQLMGLLGKHRGGSAPSSEPTAQEKALRAAEAERVARITAKGMAEFGDAPDGQSGVVACALPLEELVAGIG